MLEARKHPKIIENCFVQLPPGWYAVSLSRGAHTGIVEQMDFRRRYPKYRGTLAYDRGHYFGLAKVGYSLPQSECKGSRWANPDLPWGNIITEVLRFDDDMPGPEEPRRRSYTKLPPLGKSQTLVRAAVRYALGAGRKWSTNAEATLPEQQPAPQKSQGPKAAQVAQAPQAPQAPQVVGDLGKQATQDREQVAAEPSAGAPARALAKRKASELSAPALD